MVLPERTRVSFLNLLLYHITGPPENFCSWCLGIDGTPTTQKSVFNEILYSFGDRCTSRTKGTSLGVGREGPP